MVSDMADTKRARRTRLRTSGSKVVSDTLVPGKRRGMFVRTLPSLNRSIGHGDLLWSLLNVP